jgi:hypothetical protein
MPRIVSSALEREDEQLSALADSLETEARYWAARDLLGLEDALRAAAATARDWIDPNRP